MGRKFGSRKTIGWVGSVEKCFSEVVFIKCLKSIYGSRIGFWNNNLQVWNFGWRMNIFEWEKNLVYLLSQEIQGVSLRSGKEDSWEWKEGEKEGYTVKWVSSSSGESSWGEKQGVYEVLEV